MVALQRFSGIRIHSLAQAQQIASQGFADPDSAITHGTFGIQVGTGSQTEIAIDATNDTVQGLVDSINASDADVTASIVNDGSSSDSL